MYSHTEQIIVPTYDPVTHKVVSRHCHGFRDVAVVRRETHMNEWGERRTHVVTATLSERKCKPYAVDFVGRNL